MKYLYKIILTIVLILIISWFVYINNKNYIKHLEIRDNYVNHPEWLMNKHLAKPTSFWFANLKADLLWLQTVQYIWWNAISSEYKKYLYAITDIITELNPFFEHPYIIAQLLLPGENQIYESLTRQDKNKNTDDAIKIWLKWIDNFCDKSIIDNILNEDDLNKITDFNNPDNIYKNPCKSYKIPYYLAFLYHHHKKDPATASDYYKITSANENAVKWAKWLSAIMAWKWWNREKSIFMFLNIAESLDQNNSSCSLLSQQITKISKGVFWSKELSLDENLIKALQEARIANFWEFSKYDENQLSDTECISFLNKANRELNLAFLDQANEKYKLENNSNNSTDWQELLDKWYINFLPTDFQQYEDHWIKYTFNEELWVFDYNMSY